MSLRQTDPGVTKPIDFTDPRVVKAYAHPLRVRMLHLLNGRVASPRELANELDMPLANTSYHMRQLLALGLVELVEERPRRGAIEHRYTATFTPTLTDDGWARLPATVKHSTIGAALRHAVAELAAAGDQGGFDRPDMHCSRTAGRLDEQGWREVAAALERALGEVDAAMLAARDRLGAADDGEAAEATVLLMHFGTPKLAAADASEVAASRSKFALDGLAVRSAHGA